MEIITTETLPDEIKRRNIVFPARAPCVSQRKADTVSTAFQTTWISFKRASQTQLAKLSRIMLRHSPEILIRLRIGRENFRPSRTLPRLCLPKIFHTTTRPGQNITGFRSIRLVDVIGGMWEYWVPENNSAPTKLSGSSRGRSRVLKFPGECKNVKDYFNGRR